MQTYHSDLLVNESSGEESNLFNEYFRLIMEKRELETRAAPILTQLQQKEKQLITKWEEIQKSQFKVEQPTLFVYDNDLRQINEFGNISKLEIKKF